MSCLHQIIQAPSMQERQLLVEKMLLSKTNCSQCLELPELTLYCGPDSDLQNRDCEYQKSLLLMEQMVEGIEPSGKPCPCPSQETNPFSIVH